MIAADTGRLLGTMRTESIVHDESDGAGSPRRTAYRPYATPLRNDGRWSHWMMPGEDYDLAHDGTGWVVTYRSWPGGHTYRLATLDWDFATALPVGDSDFALDRGQRYQLRYSDHAWTLHEV